MKKTILFSIVLFCTTFCHVALAQKCKFETNTAQTKEIKKKKLFSKWRYACATGMLRNGSDFFLTLNFQIGKYKPVNNSSILENMELFLVLSDGKTMVLKAAEQVTGNLNTIITIPPVFTCDFANLRYRILAEHLQILSNTELRMVKICWMDNELNTKLCEEFEVTGKDQADIANMVKCITQ